MMARSVMVCVVVSSVLLTACRKSDTTAPAKPANPTKATVVLPPNEQAAAKIETAPATLSDAPDVLRVAGRIALADTCTWHVGVRTEGLVVQVSVGLGDRVRKGQVLARYHADELREARAQYRTARSELERAEAAAALAQHNADRMDRLVTLKAGSIQQAEQARQDLVSAQAIVRRAAIDVDRARSLLEEDLRVPVEPQAGDDTADQIPILAPATGYIIEKRVTPGKIVQPANDAFVIGDLAEVWMLASVRQEDLGGLHLGQAATVTVRGREAHVFNGTITNLGQEFDPTTRTMQVRIVLKNANNDLRPEMLVSAQFQVGSGTPMLIVAADAVQQINGQDVVFVRAAADRFAVRPVRVGEAVDGGVPVLEGLKAGEEIVTRGTFVLKSQLLRASMEGE